MLTKTIVADAGSVGMILGVVLTAISEIFVVLFLYTCIRTYVPVAGIGWLVMVEEGLSRTLTLSRSFLA